MTYVSAIEHLCDWLFMVTPNKVKPAVKSALLKYCDEAFAMLLRGHGDDPCL